MTPKDTSAPGTGTGGRTRMRRNRKKHADGQPTGADASPDASADALDAIEQQASPAATTTAPAVATSLKRGADVLEPAKPAKPAKSAKKRKLPPAKAQKKLVFAGKMDETRAAASHVAPHEAEMQELAPPAPRVRFQPPAACAPLTQETKAAVPLHKATGKKQLKVVQPAEELRTAEMTASKAPPATTAVGVSTSKLPAPAVKWKTLKVRKPWLLFKTSTMPMPVHEFLAPSLLELLKKCFQAGTATTKANVVRSVAAPVKPCECAKFGERLSALEAQFCELVQQSSDLPVIALALQKVSEYEGALIDAALAPACGRSLADAFQHAAAAPAGTPPSLSFNPALEAQDSQELGLNNALYEIELCRLLASFKEDGEKDRRPGEADENMLNWRTTSIEMDGDKDKETLASVGAFDSIVGWSSPSRV